MFLVGYCVSSIHCTSGNALLYNKRSSVPDEEVLVIGDGTKMELCNCADVVIRCADDGAVTLRNAVFVSGVPFDL